MLVCLQKDGGAEVHKQFILDLVNIQKLRNKLAHSLVDISDEALLRSVDQGVGFVQWNEGEPISKEEFEEWEIKAKMLISTLSEIKRLLPYKEMPIT